MASIGDFIEQTTTTTGTGTLSLGPPVAGRRTFVQGIGNTGIAHYVLESGDDREIGFGTVSAGTPDTLTRTLLWSSTGALLNLPSGTKRVYCTESADQLRFGGYTLPTAGGTANARTLTHAPPVRALRPGQRFRFINGASANSGAATLNVDGLGAQAIQKAGANSLAAGDLPASAQCEVVWNGTYFALVGVDLAGVAPRLLSAADAAAARAVLAAPLNAAPAGVSTAVGGAVVLPGTSGQTYDFWAMSFNVSGAATGAVIAGQNVGGTTVDPGIPGEFWVGWTRRVA